MTIRACFWLIVASGAFLFGGAALSYVISGRDTGLLAVSPSAVIALVIFAFVLISRRRASREVKAS
jgi:hypothetical protein